MKILELWIGLVAFSFGLVLMFNLGSLLPYNSYGSTQPAQLGTTMLTELIVAMLIFGGLILIVFGFGWTPRAHQEQVTPQVLPPPEGAQAPAQKRATKKA